MTVVACDGSRMALCESDAPDDYPEASFIVPSKILIEFSKIVKDSEDEVRISLATKHVIFKLGSFNYFARLIDTDYINYKRIIPTEHTTEVFVNKEAFKAALEARNAHHRG